MARLEKVDFNLIVIVVLVILVILNIGLFFGAKARFKRPKLIF